MASFLVWADNCYLSRLKVVRQSTLGEFADTSQQFGDEYSTQLLDSRT